jgi:hypothetical protein
VFGSGNAMGLPLAVLMAEAFPLKEFERATEHAACS